MGFDATSVLLSRAISTFAQEAARRLADSQPPSGYLERLLPFDPSMEAIRVFESAWRDALDADDEQQLEALRRHALRLAGLRRTCAYASTLDFLMARLSTVAADIAASGAHSCAALIAELGAVAAEVGDQKSFFPARQALQSLVQRLAALAPIPREETLVRQRFEELLGRALVADYFLETDVDRGCDLLIGLARAATGTSRGQFVLFGVAKLGALALDYGRLALAARLAFKLRTDGIDWAVARALATDEDYRLRMETLSTLAGGLFGQDVGDALVRYADWSEGLYAAFP